MNTIIEKIRAEIERRKKRNKEEYAPDGLFEEQDNLAKLLSFLYELEKEEKPIPAEGLEEDVKSWFFNEISSKINVEHTMYYYFRECARRYYELGRQSKPKVCEGLEKAAIAYSTEDAGLNPNGTEKTQVIQEEVDAFKAGAKWQKEQMLKEAVEGVVVELGETYKDQSISVDAKELNQVLQPLRLEAGDKVRIIIVKED